LYYTDDDTSYASLDLIGKYQIIAHRMEEYVRENISHINGIEGFWSYAKIWLCHYRGVPKQYFHLYLIEIIFRLNHGTRHLPVTSGNNGKNCSNFLGITLRFMFTSHDVNTHLLLIQE